MMSHSFTEDDGEKERKLKKLEPHEKPIEVRTRLPRWLDQKLRRRAAERCQSKAAIVRAMVAADLRLAKVQ